MINFFIILLFSVSIVTNAATTQDPYGNLYNNYSAEYLKQFQKGFAPTIFQFEDYYQSDDSTEEAKYFQASTSCTVKLLDYIAKNAHLMSTPPAQPVAISVSVALTNLNDVSDIEQTVSITALFNFAWFDLRLERMGLDKNEDCDYLFMTLENLRSIWKPTFIIENSAERLLYQEAWEKFPAIIINGVVTWRPSLRLTLNCDFGLLVFPYDTQYCYITIKSAGLRLFQLQYFVPDMSTALTYWPSSSINHPMWNITGQFVEPTECKQAYNTAGIRIWFRLERKSAFYLWTLILPTILISIATGLAFILSPDNGEKLGTMLTSLLAYFLVLLTMTTFTPQTSDSIPILTLFFVFIIGIGMAGAIMCAVVIRVAHSEGRKHSKKSTRAVCFCECSPWLRANFLNNILLVLYTAALAGSYIYLFSCIEANRVRLLEEQNAKQRYTDVQFFGMNETINSEMSDAI